MCSRDDARNYFNPYFFRFARMAARVHKLRLSSECICFLVEKSKLAQNLICIKIFLVRWKFTFLIMMQEKKKRRKNYFQIWSEDLCCVLAINVLMFCFCWMWEILFSIGSVLELSCEEDRDGLCLKVLLLSSRKDACGLAGSWPRCPDFTGYTSPLPSVWPRALGGVGMWGGLIR